MWAKKLWEMYMYNNMELSKSWGIHHFISFNGCRKEKEYALSKGRKKEDMVARV